MIPKRFEVKRNARALSGALALSAILFAQIAEAQAPADVDKAKTYFNAGAQAYAAGQFPAAVQAFEEAYRLAPREAILFSIAQAHRRQYYLDKQPERLTLAIKYYRRYVDAVAQGGRRADAAEALAELEPLAAALPSAASSAPTPTSSDAKAPTRVMVSSPTKDVVVTLDGKSAGELPLIEEVEPGRHTILVTGTGYFSEERELIAVEGGLVALDVPLREKPARVAITARDGAQVTVDGRPMGTLPLPAGLELTPGTHLLAITKSGYQPYSREIEVERGEERAVDAELSTTGQRVASYVLLAAGAGAAVAGGVFAGLAFRDQSTAEQILDAQTAGNITEKQRERYDKARESREDWKNAAGVTFGGAVVASVTGLLLYAFDQPVVDFGATKRDERPKAAPAKKVDDPMEVSAAPVFVPGFVGASLAARF